MMKPICLPGCMDGTATIPRPGPLTSWWHQQFHLILSSTKSILVPHEVHQRSRVYKHPDTILLHKFIELALVLYMSGTGPWLMLAITEEAAWIQYCPS